MKSKLLIVAVVVLALGSCTQKLCPTYAKQDISQPEVDQIETTTRL